MGHELSSKISEDGKLLRVKTCTFFDERCTLFLLTAVHSLSGMYCIASSIDAVIIGSSGKTVIRHH